MTDLYRHKGLRKRLVNILTTKGITDPQVLSAILHIPRHFFIDQTFADLAYQDIAFPIDSGQTISQPYTVAYQTSLLKIKNTDKVLEIGTGSGYQACVLAFLGAKVYTIERHEYLFHNTSKLLKQIGYGHIRTLLGDGYQGAERFAPFDKILLTAGADEIPKKLLAQLKIGGKLLLPYQHKNAYIMTLITRTSKSQYRRKTLDKCDFVPFLKGVVVNS